MTDSSKDDDYVILEPEEMADPDEIIEEGDETPIVILDEGEDQAEMPPEAEDDDVFIVAEEHELEGDPTSCDEEDDPVIILTEEEEAALENPPILEEEGLEEEELLEEVDDSALMERIGEAIDEELDDELAFGKRDNRILSLPRIYFAATLLIAPLLAVLFVVGREYYSLSLALRPLHYLHEALRPSGSIGLTLGVAGTLTMFASMTYLVRKKLIFWQGLGAVQAWLGFHIFTGLVGPALILFHAALVPQSAMGFLGLAAMLCVVLSGVAGRYVFAFAPKSIGGSELDVQVVKKRLVVYRNKLIELGVEPELLRNDGVDHPDEKRSPWLISAFVGIVYGDKASRMEYARLRDAVYASKGLPDQMDRILLLVRKLCRERQWAARYAEVRKLMGTWRFLHRWLAIVMFVGIFYHVLLSVNFGNLWIFR